ncbi:hypothetical protein BpHYR1_031681 [Brachionus plicatilis]|uniref:Uncharacterized protein n=1 Tax=Brachionus plicatilis TaxID=10195 RepID=A0A3M7PSJ8_BRAPC|nr:hypothetical protein BpHYR1_031681 [Brachionus plicatilis]
MTSDDMMRQFYFRHFVILELSSYVDNLKEEEAIIVEDQSVKSKIIVDKLGLLIYHFYIRLTKFSNKGFIQNLNEGYINFTEVTKNKIENFFVEEKDFLQYLQMVALTQWTE